MFKRLKDQLTGKSEPPPPPKMPPPQEGRARPQHYTFAHRVLPSLFFQNPTRFLNIMASPKALEFLRMQWDRLAQFVEMTEPYTGLDYETRRLEDDTTIIIITMPPPQAVTEAYFMAAAYRPPTDGQPALARYFTFEYGLNVMTGEAGRVVFCEWKEQMQHLNYGSQNRAADKTEFFRTVCKTLGHPLEDEPHGSDAPPAE